jgi:hypothetical protein
LQILAASEAVGILVASLVMPWVGPLRLGLDAAERGLASRIRNSHGWAAHLHTHGAEQTHDPRHRGLRAEIETYLAHFPALPVVTGPVLTLELDTDADLLRFFSTSARIDTATDATP